MATGPAGICSDGIDYVWDYLGPSWTAHGLPESTQDEKVLDRYNYLVGKDDKF